MWPLLFNPEFQVFVISWCLYEVYRVERNDYCRKVRAKIRRLKKERKLKGHSNYGPKGPHRSIAENEQAYRQREKEFSQKAVARLQKKIRRYLRLEEIAKENGSQIKRPKRLRSRIAYCKTWIAVHEKRLGIYKGQMERPPLPEEAESDQCSTLCNVHPSTVRMRLAHGSFLREQMEFHGGIRAASGRLGLGEKKPLAMRGGDHFRFLIGGSRFAIPSADHASSIPPGQCASTVRHIGD